MKTRSAFVIAVLALLSACEPAEAPVAPQLPPSSPQQPRTYDLYGTVRDTAGLAVSGARVAVTGGGPQFIGRFTMTDHHGAFRLEGLPDWVRIRVTQFGHHAVEADVWVNADTMVEVRLPRLELIPFGSLIQTTTNPPPCAPSGWDIRLFCKALYFEPHESGVLLAMIRTDGEELDARLFQVGANTDLSYNWGTEFGLMAPVTAGGNYEVRVYSYGGRQEFEVRGYLLLVP